MRCCVLTVLLFANTVLARGADKQELAAHVFSFAATVGDVETTMAALRNRQCHEYDALYGPHPSRGRMYATAVPIALVASLLAHRMKAHASKRWAWATLANGTIHASGILVNNYSGCY